MKLPGTRLKKSSGFELIADVCFFLWIIYSFFYERETSGRAMLFIYCASVVVLMLFKAKVYDGNSKLSAFNMYFISYVGFLIYVYWHTFIAKMPIEAETASKMFTTVCINGIFYYIVYKHCIMKKDLMEIVYIYLWAIMLIVVYIVFKLNTGLLSGRLGSGMDINSNSIALCIVTCIIILLYSYKDNRKIWKLLLICAMMFFVLLSGSRKGLIGLAGGMVFFFSLGKGLSLKRLMSIILIILVIALLYIMVMRIDFLYDIAGYRLEALLSFMSGSNANEASLDVRSKFGEIGWEYVAKNPIFGYGIDCFRDIKGAYGTYSHNNYLELLFGVGIIGTTLYYISYIYILFGHMRLYKKYGINESKFFTTLICTQLILEYAYVSYFSRPNMVMIIIALASYRSINDKAMKGLIKDASVA